MRRVWALPNMRPVERKRLFEPVSLGLGLGLMGLSAGAGMLGNATRGKGEPAKLVYADPSRVPSWLQPQLNFGQNQIEAMSRGEAAPYLTDIGKLQRKSSMKSLQDMFLGNQFSPGALGMQMGYDVSRGLARGGSGSNAYGGQIQNMADRERAIDDSINQMVFKGSYDYSTAMPAMMNQTSQAAYPWTVPSNVLPGTPPQGNNWDSLSAALGMAGPAFALSSFGSTGTQGGSSQPSIGGGFPSFPWTDMGGGPSPVSPTGGTGWSGGGGWGGNMASGGGGWGGNMAPYLAGGGASTLLPMAAGNYAFNDSMNKGQQYGQQAGVNSNYSNQVLDSMKRFLATGSLY